MTILKAADLGELASRMRDKADTITDTQVKGQYLDRADLLESWGEKYDELHMQDRHERIGQAYAEFSRWPL